MKTKIVAFDIGSTPQNHKALDFFTKMGLLSFMTENEIKTADAMALGANDRVLVIGAGTDPKVLVAYAAGGAKVDLVQPSEAKIATNTILQTKLLQRTLENILVKAKIERLSEDIGPIDITSFVGYIQNVGLPKGSFNVALIPNVFDIQPSAQKPVFMKALMSSLKDNAVILVSFYGQKEERVLTLLQEIREGIADNGFIIQQESVSKGSLSYDETDVYKLNVRRSASKLSTFFRNIMWR